MPDLQPLRDLLQSRSPDDRVLFWHWFGAPSPSRYVVESTPDVCGGEPRIVRTRIPVWVLERMRQLGLSEADILRSYPTLRAADLVAAWDYVDLHKEEIGQQIRNNEEDAD